MKKRLNILFYSYQHLEFNSGGIQDQIKYSKMALETLGHNVFYLEDWFINKPHIHVCHQFSLHFTLTNTFWELKSLKFPIVISTVFNEKPSFLNDLLRRLSALKIPLLYHRNTKYFLSNCDYLISLGDSETKLLIKKYQFETPIISIPNGLCDEIIEYFYRKTDSNEQYVVCVGTICERKNQLRLIKACNELNLKLLLIGPESEGESDYIQKCKDEAGKNVIFLGYVNNKSEEFMQIVSNASVFALVSRNEVLPISVFESIALGTPVSCTKNCSVSDYFKDEQIVDFCDPFSLSDIKRSLQKLLNSNVKCSISDEVKNEYTWLNVAKKIESVYYNVIGI